MKKLRNACFLAIGLISVFSKSLQAQSKEELQRQTQEILREIENDKQVLAATKKDKKLTLGDLRGIERRIDLRNRVITNIKGEIFYVEKDIIRNLRDIDTLQQELSLLKQQYAQSIIYAYKNRSNYNLLNFLFSADNFSDVLKRISYLKTYRNFREQKAGDILRTQELLKKKIDQNNVKRQEKSNALKEQNTQMVAMEEEKKEKDKAVKALSAKESQLNAMIKKKESERKKVQNAIAAVIRREKEEALRKEREKQKAAAANNANNSNTASTPTTKPNTSAVTGNKPVSAKPRETNVLETTPEGLITSQQFEGNRGNLPWPVDKGIITLHYGTNFITVPGASRPIEIPSSGLTIQTEIGSRVKAVFEGEVVTVSNIGENKMVMIKHGKYFTTYTNLQSASVSRGQKVATGQSIGTAGSNDEGVGSIDFQMDTDKGTINPEQWIKRR